VPQSINRHYSVSCMQASLSCTESICCRLSGDGKKASCWFVKLCGKMLM